METRRREREIPLRHCCCMLSDSEIIYSAHPPLQKGAGRDRRSCVHIDCFSGGSQSYFQKDVYAGKKFVCIANGRITCRLDSSKSAPKYIVFCQPIDGISYFCVKAKIGSILREKLVASARGKLRIELVHIWWVYFERKDGTAISSLIHQLLNKIAPLFAPKIHLRRCHSERIAFEFFRAALNKAFDQIYALFSHQEVAPHWIDYI